MASRSMARRRTTRVPSSRVGHVTRADRLVMTFHELLAARHRQTVRGDQLFLCRRNWRTAKNILLPKDRRRNFQGCRSFRSFLPARSRIRATRASYPQATTTALETRSSAGEKRTSHAGHRVASRAARARGNPTVAGLRQVLCRAGGAPVPARRSRRPRDRPPPSNRSVYPIEGKPARSRGAGTPRASPARALDASIAREKSAPLLTFLRTFLSRAVNSG